MRSKRDNPPRKMFERRPVRLLRRYIPLDELFLTAAIEEVVCIQPWEDAQEHPYPRSPERSYWSAAGYKVRLPSYT